MMRPRMLSSPISRESALLITTPSDVPQSSSLMITSWATSIKRRVRACQGFRSFAAAERTIQGIETVNMIRKGQVRWLAKDDITGHVAFVARLFELTNGGTYVELSSRVNDPAAWLKELQQYGRVLRSYFDTLAVDFLNTPLLGDLRITVHRLLGPNFHAISYAYALAFFALVLAASGNVLYLLAAAPLLLLIGSKGAIVLVIAAIAGLIVSRFIRWRGLFWLYVAALLAWAAAGIVIGLRAGDYHVIGFLGGLENFAHHPLGIAVAVMVCQIKRAPARFKHLVEQF